MTNENQTAKDRVISWMRSNYPEIPDSSLELRHLLIFLAEETGDRSIAEGIDTMLSTYKRTLWIENCYGGADFDLTKPLKDQDEETFFKPLLSLIES